MSDVVSSHGGRRLGAGKPHGPVRVADRYKRYAVAEKAAKYADEIIECHLEIMRDEGELPTIRMAAGRWIWEAAFKGFLLGWSWP
jgi:hypothetical protein